MKKAHITVLIILTVFVCFVAGLCIMLCDSDTGDTGAAHLNKDSNHVIPYEAELDDWRLGGRAVGNASNRENSEYYTNIDFFDKQSTDNLHIISNFATYQQSEEFSCAPACARMVLHHYGEDGYSEKDIAEMANTDEIYGTVAKDVAQCFKDIGYEVECHYSAEKKFPDYKTAKEFFLNNIDNNVPVMVNTDWIGGHWQVVIGYDTAGTNNITDYTYEDVLRMGKNYTDYVSYCDDVIILADPYDIFDHRQDGYTTMPFVIFCGIWKEGRSADGVVHLQPYVTAVPVGTGK